MFDFKYIYKSGFNKLHSIHSYPAKFPPSIPLQLINKLANKGDIILDPFCGSGTTLLEGIINGYNVIGNDINYIALLISEVKTTLYNKNDLNIIKEFLYNLNNKYFLKDKIKNKIVFDGINHWFQDNVQYELNLIIKLINELKDNRIKNYLKLIVSEITINVSNQESDTRYASKNKNITDGFTIQIYKNKVIENFDYLLKKENLKNYGNAKIILEDSKKLKSINDDSIDLIITSPPYANTYDYYLYHKHRMNWLGYDYKISQNMEIGSRREYSSLKKNKQKWFNDIEEFIMNFYRVLKKDKYMCLIIGDSVINKELIDISNIIKDITKKFNLKLYYHDFVSLKSNTRKFNHKFGSNLDKNEHILIFKKF